MCTGDTRHRLVFRNCCPVYPCVYREHFIISVILINIFGLSLCVQGTHGIFKYFTGVSRFIPVCTGNTPWRLINKSDISVYPCVYREHVNALLSQCFGVRFIPVCTGNTNFTGRSTGNNSVYPCVYREHSFNRLTSRMACGLSLCIQGTQKNDNNRQTECRFIPVYTGNT